MTEESYLFHRENRHTRRRILVWIVSTLLSLTAAEQIQATQALPAASPESQGIRSGGLRQLLLLVKQGKYDVRSMIVLRHGQMVLEWYAGGVSREHNHNIYSVTKSVVGTLTGIAIDQGQLQGANVLVSAFFSDAEFFDGDARKSRITVRDLLTMRSGLPTARSYNSDGFPKALFQRIHRTPDRARYILGLKMQCAPGGTFRYGNAEPQLVVSILERATSRQALALAEQTLFGPLGFKNYQWLYPDKCGTVAGGYGLRLRAIDMAKLGQLYLQGGRWGRRQLVSKAWIEAASSDQTGKGYGYYWWTGVPAGGHRSYAAKGAWGQRIQVIPELDLVLVVTANLTPQQTKSLFPTLVDRMVHDAVQSDSARPECPEELLLLRDEIADSCRYIPPGRLGLDAARLPRLPGS